MKKILCLAFLLLATGCSINNHPDTEQTQNPMENTYNKKLTVERKELWVEIATTPEQHSKGLSGRGSLGGNQGMLFDYQGKLLTPAFWMPDMKFNIDILWIREGKIIGITKDVPAPQDATASLPHYYPPGPIDMVLEVNSGWSENNSIEIGNEVQF
jgi:uncharacterized protein